jgi:hypothetical protein
MRHKCWVGGLSSEITPKFGIFVPLTNYGNFPHVWEDLLPPDATTGAAGTTTSQEHAVWCSLLPGRTTSQHHVAEECCSCREPQAPQIEDHSCDFYVPDHNHICVRPSMCA